MEVVHPTSQSEKPVVIKQLKASEEKWLVDRVESFFAEIEKAPAFLEKELDQLYVLIGALKVLGAHGAAQSFIARLTELKKRTADGEYSV